MIKAILYKLKQLELTREDDTPSEEDLIRLNKLLNLESVYVEKSLGFNESSDDSFLYSFYRFLSDVLCSRMENTKEESLDVYRAYKNYGREGF